MLLSGAALTLGAQYARGAGLDFMLGAQRSTGGLLKERRGLFVDATGATAVLALSPRCSSTDSLIYPSREATGSPRFASSDPSPVGQQRT